MSLYLVDKLVHSLGLVFLTECYFAVSSHVMLSVFLARDVSSDCKQLPSCRRHFLPYSIPLAFFFVRAAIVSMLAVQDPMALESSW